MIAQERKHRRPNTKHSNSTNSNNDIYINLCTSLKKGKNNHISEEQENTQKDSHQKQHKISIVSHTNTIVDKPTMMIKHQNAIITVRTM
jgi:hypothetical protein